MQLNCQRLRKQKSPPSPVGMDEGEEALSHQGRGGLNWVNRYFGVLEGLLTKENRIWYSFQEFNLVNT